jgi:hypothetical protein
MCKAIFRKFLSFLPGYILVGVLSCPVSLAMSATLLVFDDNRLMSFHEVLCPVLPHNTWTDVIARNSASVLATLQCAASSRSKEFLRQLFT